MGNLVEKSELRNMTGIFADRRDAGKQLGRELRKIVDDLDARSEAE